LAQANSHPKHATQAAWSATTTFFIVSPPLGQFDPAIKLIVQLLSTGFHSTFNINACQHQAEFLQAFNHSWVQSAKV
jgi:hypothetical protein